MLSTSPLKDPQNLICHSKLMQNYKAEVPVSVGGQIAVTTDAQGELVLFSLSTANNVLCLRPDPASDTGWQQTLTGLTAEQIGVGLTADGTLLVVAPGPSSGPTPSITVVEETTGGWSAPQTVTPPTNNNPSPIVAVTVQNVGGTLYIAYFLALDPTLCAGAPPYLGWIGAWDNASKAVVNPFPVLWVDPFTLLAGTDAEGQASYFTTWTPQIYTRLTTQYQASNIYWDKGSGTPMNVAFWRPVPPVGYFAVGDLALGGSKYEYTPPTAAMLTILPVSDYTGTILAPTYQPQSDEFQRVWSDQHSGADEDGAVWVPQHAGYVPLGQVATRGYVASQSTLPAAYLMVRADLAVPGTLYQQIPNCVSDEGEGCNQFLIYGNWKGHSGVAKVAVDGIQADASGIAAAAFSAHADWNIPTGPAWCLASNPTLNSLAVRFDPAGDYLTGCSAVGVPSPSRVVTSATAVDAGGTTRFFGILADGGLYFLDQSAGAWVGLDPGRTYAALAPTLDASGNLEVFAIGTDRALYHVRQNAQAPGGWSQMAPLETLNQYALIAAGRDLDGHSAGFAVTATGALWRLFQDPTTTTWNVAQIELGDLGSVQEVRTFTTEISFSDADLVPQPNYPVTIWSDDLVAASVNDEVFLLDGTPRVTCNTDFAGKLTVTVETTELTAPVLYVRTPAMRPKESVSIVPNAEIQDRLRTVDGATLTQKLGVDPSNADAAAQAINAAMSLSRKKPPDGGQAAKYLRRNRDLRGLRCRADDSEPSPARIDLAAVPEQHWRIELKDGVRFTKLSAAEARSIMALERSRLPAAEGFVDWLDDLGDLFQAAVDGIAEVVSYTVTAVTHAIDAAVTFIVDGVTYVFNATIDLVEQAFDIVGTVFQAVGVAFEDLVQWLGFLFNWPDIVRTKDALAHAILQTLPLVKLAAGKIAESADHGIATLKGELQHSVHEVLEKVLGPTNSPISFNEQHGTPPQVLDHTAGTNVVLSGFTANADAALPMSSSALTGPLPGAVVDFWTLLEQQAGPDGPFQSSEGFSNALAYLEQIGDRPDQFMQLLFAALLSALEGVAEAALDLAQIVVDAFCAALSGLVDWMLTMLTTPWEIPYVSTLYSTYISPGSKLTALDLFCLITAIPTTIVYKVVNNAAPFPDRAALDLFKGYYTTAWLRQVSGLKGSEVGQAALDPPPEWRELLRLVFGLALFGSYAAYCVVEYQLDSCPTLAPDQPAPGWGIAALVIEASIWAFSLPWADPENNSGLGCKDGNAVGNLIWLTVGLVPFAIDIMCFAAQKRIARNINDIGVVFDFLATLGVLVGSIVALAKQDTRSWAFGIGTFGALLSVCRFVRWTPATAAICAAIEPMPDCPGQVAKAAALFDLFGDAVSSVMIVVNTIYVEDESGMRLRVAPLLVPPPGQA